MKFQKLLFIILFFSICLNPELVLAEEEKVNAGIVNGIWYSKLPFFAGEKIEIYVALHNQSGFDIRGLIQFFDGDELIGEADFSASSGGFIRESIEWGVSPGYHSISVRAKDVQRQRSGVFESVSLDIDFIKVSEQFADFDTDGDGIGDLDDPDKDNDQLSNEEEIVIATDPLVFDTDGDGVSDGEEVKGGTRPLIPNSEERTEIKEENSFIINEETIVNNSFLSPEQMEFIKDVISLATEQTHKTKRVVLEKIEEEKIKNEEKIEEGKSKPVLKDSFALIDTDFYSLTIPEENIPSWEQFYNYLLDFISFIVENPWLLTIIIIVVLRFLFGIFNK